MSFLNQILLLLSTSFLLTLITNSLLLLYVYFKLNTRIEILKELQEFTDRMVHEQHHQTYVSKEDQRHNDFVDAVKTLTNEKS